MHALTQDSKPYQLMSTHSFVQLHLLIHLFCCTGAVEYTRYAYEVCVLCSKGAPKKGQRRLIEVRISTYYKISTEHTEKGITLTNWRMKTGGSSKVIPMTKIQQRACSLWNATLTFS